MKLARLLLPLSLHLITITTLAQEGAAILRFPTMHGDNVVFTHGGDLYWVDADGGMARKLTSDPGFEMFAKFSPDGQWIAFTGQYDGNTEVYLIPAEGGEPTRLTYTATLNRDDISDRMGPNNIVMGWTPDSKHIVFRSRMKSFNSFKGQLFKISIEGGLPEQLPFATAGFCSYSPDGKQIAFNKVFREFRTWKYYKGGMADDIKIFNFETKEMRTITDNLAQDMQPMWYGNTIYFLSDRDRTMNIFKYNLNTNQVSKVTNYTDYDVKFPSLGDEGIVFEQAGRLHILDLGDNSVTDIAVEIADDNRFARPTRIEGEKFVEGTEIAPDGSRVLFVARGDLFTVPAEEGVTRHLRNTDGAHERQATWSPDGQQIAFISDISGEDEIYVMDAKGKSDPVQLTTGGDTYKYGLEWSPDGKKILWSDKKLRLQYVDVATKKVTLVDEAEAWEIREYVWSPNSQWIAYTKPMVRAFGQIFFHNTANQESFAVTDEWYQSGNPHFSKDGKYFFFVSARDFDPIYSWTEWNHAYADMTRVYLLTLKKDTPSPFGYENNEVKMDEKKEDKKEEAAEDFGIDTEGLQSRITAIPTDAGSYGNIQYVDGKLYYSFNKMGAKRATKFYDLAKEKEETVGEFNLQISRDGKKALVSKDKKYYVMDLPGKDAKPEKPVDMSNVVKLVDLREEWSQIFNEAWRQMRDFFYDPGMHGVDWKAIKAKYEPWVRHAGHRADLNYVIGEMIGELNVGHAYVGDGDVPKVEKLKMGLLGAEVTRHSSGYYQVDHILQGENWRKDARSPFTEIGVDVNEGDYLISINGTDLKNVDNPYIELIGQAGKLVELTVNSQPKADGARTVLVKPTDDEAELYYYNWVRENIRKVSEATNGRVGYLHIPDMGQTGLNEFVKHFYPQLGKEALIIDVRGNGGGNVSPMIIERLRRELAMVDKARNVAPQPDPDDMILGPLVTLLDQWSASDGDLFPYRFKHYKLGTLIGHRSWGGVVGIRGSLPFVDGGYLYKPEFASYATDGSKWIIEGHGVDPDIEVDNNVYKEYVGEDEQLNKGIEVILKQLEDGEYGLPEAPPYPDKSK